MEQRQIYIKSIYDASIAIRKFKDYDYKLGEAGIDVYPIIEEIEKKQAQLAEESEAICEAETQLEVMREKAHRTRAELWKIIQDGKNRVKTQFKKSQWKEFGIFDKR